MARALQLVKCDETGNLQVQEDAAQILRSVRGPVAVLCVCGRARQGKSFLLNQIATAASTTSSGCSKNKGKESEGFKVAATHRPCTKGIWLWSKPIPRVGADGSKYHLILLDTEGIDAYDQTGQYSTQIFSLSVLLSSLFVYNQMGGIDEAALDKLSLVTEMTKHIRVRSREEGEGEDNEAGDLGACSPNFLWLLRDFFLDLSEDGCEISAREYLELALRAVPGAGASVEAKNHIRQSIKGLFPDRDCFTLVRPVMDERQLQRLGDVEMEALRPEFREGLKELLGRVFSKAVPKTMGRTMLTGGMLAGLAEVYVSAINNGAVPVISTAWQGVAEAECRRAMEEAEAEYMQLVQQGGGEDLDTLNSAHEAALVQALHIFSQAAVGDGQARQEFEGRLRQTLVARHSDMETRLQAAAAAKCTEMASAASTRLHKASRAQDADVAGLAEVAGREVTKLATSARGPQVAQQVATLAAEVALGREGLVAELASRREADVKARLAAAESEVQQAGERARGLEDSLAEARAEGERAGEQIRETKDRLTQLQVEATRHQEQGKAAQARVQGLEGEVERERGERARERGEAQENLKEAASLRQRDQARHQERESALAKEVTALKGQVEATKAEAARGRDLIATKEAQLNTCQRELERAKETETDLRKQVVEAEASCRKSESAARERQRELSEALERERREAGRLREDGVREAEQASRSLEKERSEWRAREVQLLEEIQDLQQKTKASEAKDKNMQKEVAQRESVLEGRLHRERGEWEARERALKQEVRDLTAQAEAARDQADKAASEAASARSSLQASRQQRESQVERQAREVEERREAEAEARREVERLRREAEEARGEAARAKREAERARREAEDKDKENEARVKEMSKENARMFEERLMERAKEAQACRSPDLFMDAQQTPPFHSPPPEVPSPDHRETNSRRPGGNKRGRSPPPPTEEMEDDEVPAPQAKTRKTVAAGGKSKKGKAGKAVQGVSESKGSTMTVAQLKQALTQAGLEGEIWGLTKKADLVALYDAKMS